MHATKPKHVAKPADTKERTCAENRYEGGVPHFFLPMAADARVAEIQERIKVAAAEE